MQEYLCSLDPALLRKARLLRKQINKQVKVAKADFLKHKLDGCEGNPAKFWRGLNSIIKSKAHGDPFVTFEHHKTGEEVPSEQVASYINTFFFQHWKRVVSKVLKRSSSATNTIRPRAWFRSA